jgi:Kef-type K+ transport system membrane component KefB
VVRLKKTASLYFLFSGAVYCAGMIVYAVQGQKLYPFLGGWIAGLLVMEGLNRRKLESA